MALRFLVVGYGRVGRAITLRLKSRGHHVETVDVRRSNDKIADEHHVIDASKSPRDIARLASKFDCACGCLPGGLGYKFIAACADYGVKLVDVSFTSEDPLTLNSRALKTESLIIPDCGIAPGLSNMIIGLSARKMSFIEKAEIKVGGIPKRPRPPLYHSSSWSVEDLLEEYIRPVRYVENHEVKVCDPLSLKVPFKFKGLELEAFPTDGLRTLLRMKNRPKFMRELTIRWKDHLDVIKSLRELGFFDDDKVDLGGVKMPIRALTAKILEKAMPRNDDMIVMEIEIHGIKDNKEVKGYLRIHGSLANEVSTMAKITGTVCSEVALMVAQGQINDIGVVPPEDLNKLDEVTLQVLNELKKLGIQIEVEGLEPLGIH
ncbi:MAG: hypothetical protein DRJ60_02555 [Thermoprotei archaeon]|nr:MAG: hypothetical protein DRJ60_02555 [Thermoprotei archaeon]